MKRDSENETHADKAEHARVARERRESPKTHVTEQTRILVKRIVRNTFAATVVYAVVFFSIAMAVNLLVLPQVGEAVAKVTSPWQYVSSDVAGVQDDEWFIQKENELKADVVRKYLHELIDTAVPDAGWGLAQSAANAKNVQTEGANPEAVYTISSQPADAGEYAASASQGLVQGDSLSFVGAPYASQAAKQVVISAVDSRNLGQAANVYDALWSATKDWDNKPEQVDSLYEEAAAALDSDFSQVVVRYDYDAGSGIETVTYAGGQQMQRDLSSYNNIRALKYPVAITLFLSGILVIMAFAIRKSLRYFDDLFVSLRAVLVDKGASLKLPSELSLAEESINDIKRKNDAEQRAAVAAERRKNELVAYLAHDTKTPLTSITGYLTLLEEAPDMPVEQRQRYAHVALSKAYRLDAMLDEFFEITRYNLGAISIERERFDLALFCYQVAEDFYPEAESRGIDLKVNATEGDTVFADATKMARVLSNVIKNAVAYADPDSTISIDAHAKPDGAFKIEVSNQGREISPEHLKRIFEKFYREDDARATRQGGAGLGLAIAREIVAAHNGTIDATSENGVTRFVVDIPASK